MNENGTRIGSAPLRGARLAVVLVAVVAWMPGALRAEDPPGFIDADRFVDLVGDDAIRVEVNISPALLRMMAAGLGDAEPDLTETIEGLRGIRALVIDVSTDATRDRIETTVTQTVRDIEKSGWERLALVRDDTSVLHVMVRGDETDRVRGLLILILERESNELVFVNLHGLIDLAKLQALSEEMDLPGLDRVPSPDED